MSARHIIAIAAFVAGLLLASIVAVVVAGNSSAARPSPAVVQMRCEQASEYQTDPSGDPLDGPGLDAWLSACFKRGGP